MNNRVLPWAALALLAATLTARAQIVLALDFNMRAGDTPANTQAGFTNFSMTAASGIQTGPSTRTYGPLTVTVANSGAPGYDDRLRGAPVNSGNFTESLLLRDFIFSRDGTGNSGLDVTVTGLTPDASYRFTVWSFDASSPGNRVSDWSINGSVVTNGYAFNGSVAPANNSQYQIVFVANADTSGQVVISARRNSASVDGANAASFGVFLNALLIELPLPTAPAIVGNPVNVDLYSGDNAVFNGAASGTAPLTYYWLHDTNIVAIGASPNLAVPNTRLRNAGGYSFIASNVSGTATSTVAQLTVRDVPNITAGLLAYWPLDDITDSVADLSTNGNILWATNMDLSNLADGRPTSALAFNGVDEFLTRTNASDGTLPASRYPAYTIALWVKGDGTTQLDKRVFCEGSSLNNLPLLTLGTGNPVGTNALDIFIRNDDGSTPVSHRKTSLAVFDDTWHHVAWVDNNGSGAVYVDGARDTNNFDYVRGVLTPNIDTLGAVYRTNAQALFNGAMDDVVIFRRSLTQDEVKYVMARGPTRVRTVITHIGVTNPGAAPTVTLTVAPVDPTVAYGIAQTGDIGAMPIQWDVVADTAATRDGDVMTFQFTGSPQTKFYRIVGYTSP